MGFPFSRTLLGAAAVASLGTAVIWSKRGEREGTARGTTPAEPSADVERAARRFLLYALLPAWVVPGFGDYLCHRAAKIERTSGTHESVTHLLMIATSGVGVLTGLICEIDPSSLIVLAASALAHEGVVLWDVAYAARLRPPSATEQHLHSFLEVLPFASLAFTGCLHPGAVAALMKKPVPTRFLLRRKANLSLPYILSLGSLIATLVVIPHLEEFIRCYRVDRTIFPHLRPIDELPGA